MEKTDIKKRVHAYLFRHTRITESASFMTESEMDHYFGWVQGSNMPQVYVHLSGREVDDKLLRHYKLRKDKEEEKNDDKPKRCPRCKEVNDPKARYCNRCGLAMGDWINERSDKSIIERLLSDPDEYLQLREAYLREEKEAETCKVVDKMS